MLREFLHDHEEVIRQSCEVALDAADYFGHAAGEQHTAEAAQDELLRVAVGATAAVAVDGGGRGDDAAGTAGSVFAREKAAAGLQKAMGDLHFNRVAAAAKSAQPPVVDSHSA